MHKLGKVSYCLGLAYSSAPIHAAYPTFSTRLTLQKNTLISTIPASTIRYDIVGLNLTSDTGVCLREAQLCDVLHLYLKKAFV